MQRRSFVHGDLTLSYLDQGGAGTPLIALHATWMEASTFAELAEALAPRWRVLALDQRGHGYSDHSEDLSWDAFIGDLGAFIDHLTIKTPVNLLGNSLGGVVAFRYAARNPAKVKAMVIEESAAVLNPDFNFIRTWAGKYPTREALRERIGERLAWSVEPSFREGQSGWTLAFSPEQLADALGELKGDFWRDWTLSNCPTLLIRGSESRVVDGDILARMAEVRPKTFLKTFRAGHVVHHDALKPFAVEVANFLDSV